MGPTAADPAVEQALAVGLASLGLSPAAKTRRQLLAFLALLAKWNRVFNLTAVRDPRSMLSRHLLDSLAVLPYLVLPRVLDVGTGAGLPGIPLALLCPEGDFTLLDSNRKKTRFVTQAVAELGLENVNVVHCRVEEYQPGTVFDTVIARAYSSIEALVTQTHSLCAPKGRILAMKGLYPTSELDSLPAGWMLEAVHRLEIPGDSGQRHLVVIQRDSDEE